MDFPKGMGERQKEGHDQRQEHRHGFDQIRGGGAHHAVGFHGRVERLNRLGEKLALVSGARRGIAGGQQIARLIETLARGGRLDALRLDAAHAIVVQDYRVDARRCS